MYGLPPCLEELNLDLDYNPAVSARLIATLERRARTLGLDLDTVELLGQEARVAVAFVRATRAGDAHSFVARVDFDALRRMRKSRLDRGSDLDAADFDFGLAAA